MINDDKIVNNFFKVSYLNPKKFQKNIIPNLHSFSYYLNIVSQVYFFTFSNSPQE